MIQINQLKGLSHIRECYYVNQFGDVINKNTNHKKAHSTDVRGYKYVTLAGQDNSDYQYKVFVHKLVALAYLPNPKNRVEVNHRDGKPSNNFVMNLEWSTRIENMRHAWDTGLIVRKERKFYIIFFRKGNPIEFLSYGTMKELARRTGIPRGTLYDYLYNPWKVGRDWFRDQEFRIMTLVEFPESQQTIES